MPKLDFGLRPPSWMLKVYGILLLGFICSSHGNAQTACAIACNNLLQISVDGNCEVDFTADLLLEGNPNPAAGPFTLTIASLNIFKETLPINDFNLPIGTYQFEVGNACGNSCWGSFFAEHNISPMLTGEISCPKDDPCSFPCVALDLIYNDTSFTTALNPSFQELCAGTLDVDWNDQLISDRNSCIPDTLIRTWTTNVVKHGVPTKVILAEQYFLFDSIPLNYVFCPVTPFTVPCEVGSDPDSISAFFDIDSTLQNEGVRYAYPFIALTGSGTSLIDPLSGSGVDIMNGIFDKGVTFLPIKGTLGTCNIASAYVDNNIPICTSGNTLTSYKVVRTWTTFDWCTARSINCVQVIKVVDEEGPSFYVTDTLRLNTSPWVCGVTFDVPPPDSLMDNCSGSEFSYNIYIDGQPNIKINGNQASGFSIVDLQKGDNRLVYEVRDNCDNLTRDTTVLWINDNTPPVAIAKEHIVVSLTSSGNSAGYAKLFAPSVDNGSYDICTPVKLEIRREKDLCGIIGNDTYTSSRNKHDINYETHADSTQLVDPDDGAFIKFCCADLTEGTYGIHKVWMRVWDDANMDGIPGTYGDNYNEVWAFVRVEDKLNVVIDCPEDVTIRCSDDYTNLNLTGKATAIGTCAFELDYEDELPGGACPTGTVKRKWFVDGNGNDTFEIGERYCTQLIHINDLDPITCNDIIFPRDTVATCADAFTEQAPIWSEDHCGLLGYSVDIDIFEIDEEYCFKIIKTYTVIDWCQYDPNNSSTVGICTGVQKIGVMDNTAPVIEECEDKIYLEGDADCLATNIELTHIATDNDNCPVSKLRWSICLDIDNDGDCDYSYNRSSDSGEEMSLLLTDTSGVALSLSAGPHRVKWVVTDNCGNSSECESLLIIIDNKNPTPICIQSISTAVMSTSGSVEIWAVDFDPDMKSFDNCDDELTYSFSGSEITPSLEIGCNAAADLMISNGVSEVFELEMWVWDDGYDINCDGTITLDERNKDYCTVMLRVDDHVDVCLDTTIVVAGSAMISGSLQTVYGDMVGDAQVMLDGSHPEYPSMMVTQNDGLYAFDNNPMNFNYELTAQKEDAYINGVSTLDLVLIQKHILGLTILDSPYKVIASDVNNDQKISGIDLIELRKLILGIYDVLPANDSWKFVEKAQSFPNESTPFPFIEDIQINELNNDMMGADFVGIKVGDVNGSAKANKLMTTEVRSTGEIEFLLADKAFEVNEVIQIAFDADNISELYGMQFTLSHSGLELIDILPGALDVNEDNIAQFGEDLLSFSWNDVLAQTISGTLFTMEFKSQVEGKVSEVLSLSDRITHTEAYLTESYDFVDIALQFNDKNGFDNFELYQNEPNPFADKTSISFHLPTSADATLKIYDVTGKVLKEFTQHYNMGLNEIVIERSELGNAGILYYQLEAGVYTSTKKMVMLR